MLLSSPVEAEENVRLNPAELCVLVFPTSTSTNLIARFHMSVLRLMRKLRRVALLARGGRRACRL